MTTKKMSCLNCGVLIDYRCHNHLLCRDCADVLGEKIIMLDCINCGVINTTDKMTLIPSAWSYVCKNCEESECFVCDRCEELAFVDESVTIPGDVRLCVDCWEYEETYLFCECGEIVRYDEVDENYLCEECQRYHGLI